MGIYPIEKLPREGRPIPEGWALDSNGVMGSHRPWADPRRGWTFVSTGHGAVRWEPLTIRGGQMHGRATIELREAASAMTPVRPLGSYRVDIDGQGSRADVGLQTLSGPLKLTGKGTWDARAGLRFEADASAEPNEAERLQSFLGLVGRREGGRTIIRIGA